MSRSAAQTEPGGGELARHLGINQDVPLETRAIKIVNIAIALLVSNPVMRFLIDLGGLVLLTIIVT